MSYSNYKITLDVRKTVASIQLAAKKGDAGRKIYITLSDHGVPCKIADGCYAVFAGTKPDGTLLYNKTTVEDNTIIYAMTQQTTAVAGLVACEVKLFDSMSNLLTSPKLTILVDDVVVPDEEIASKDEVTALAELILNGGGSGGSVTDEQIASAVEDYFAENPMECADAVKTVNGIAPDENGNVEITIPGGASIHACTYTGTISDYGYIAYTAGKNCFPNGDPKVGDLFVTTTGHLCRVLVVAPGTDSEGKPSVLIQYAHMRDLNGQPGNDYVLTEADKQEIAEQAAQMVEVPQGTGITDPAKNLLISILRNGVYSTDQSANITALESALASSGGGDVPDIPDEPDVPDEPDEPNEPHTHSYTSSVTKAATCEADGVRTYVCACGHSYTESIPATGHKYVDGTCTNCGAADPGYEEIENNGWVDGQPYELNKIDCLSLDTTTGETVAAGSGTMTTDYLPCLGVSAFTYEVYDGASILNSALYDKEKNFKIANGFLTATDPAVGATNSGIKLPLYYIVPKGTAYVRFTQRSSFKCLHSVTPHKYPVLTETTESEAGRWYECKSVPGSVDVNTGVLREDTSWYRTGYCMIYGVSKAHFSYPARKSVVFYDNNKNYISGETINNKTAFDIPENAVYMVASSTAMNNMHVWFEE